MSKISIESSAGKILFAMKATNRPMKVSDFSDKSQNGYEAGTRIGDLVRQGLVRNCGIEIGPKGQRFAKYELTDMGRDYKFEIKPIETTIVYKGKPVAEIIGSPSEKFIGNTNIRNPNYKNWFQRTFSF